jgi:hypothetical protein
LIQKSIGDGRTDTFALERSLFAVISLFIILPVPLLDRCKW